MASKDPSKYLDISQNINKKSLETVGEIGAGSFGVVYLAYYPNLKEKVAVKCMTRPTSDANTRKDFEHEAAKLLQVKHEHIINLYGVCRVDGSIVALVMAYMQYGSLSRILFNLPEVQLPWALRIRILFQVARAINYLHQLQPKILHLDLKSQNILLNDDFHIQICDFGLSHWKRGSSSRHLEAVLDHPVGTITHMAPESLCPGTITPNEKYDVYSFSIVTWEVISRKKPHDNFTDRIQLLQQIKQLEIRPPTENILPQDLPEKYKIQEQVIPLMMKCWDQNPDNRPFFPEIVENLNPLNESFKLEAKQAAVDVSHAMGNQNRFASLARNFEKKVTLDEALSAHMSSPSMSSNMSSTFDLETDADPSPTDEKERPKHKHQQRGNPSKNNTGWYGSSCEAQYAHGNSKSWGTKKVEVNVKDCYQVHVGHTINNFYNVPPGSSSVSSSYGTPQRPKRSKEPIHIRDANKVLSNSDISATSEKVGSRWRQFGRALGFEDGELETVYHDRIQEGLAEVNYCLISRWREKFGKEATRQAFTERMKSIGSFDLVECLAKQNI